MSTLHLNIGHTPQGTIKRGTDRLILRYIQEHPGCLDTGVSEFVRVQREHHLNGGLAEVPAHPDQRLQWIRKRIQRLTLSNHVVTRTTYLGGVRESRYFPLKVDGVFQGAGHGTADGATVAQPSRYDVMRCPDYKPPRPNVRPGGMDFARHPSLHNGKPHPFVPGR